MLKVLTHPVSRKTFKMGRRIRPEAHLRPRLHLRDYVKLDVATPATADYTVKPLTFLRDILGNDTLGDCTIAGLLHVGGAWLGNADQPIPYTDADAIRLYEKACGYDPSNPSTDQGGDEVDVLNCAMQAGLAADGSHKIAGWSGVDATDAALVKQAGYLFENVYFGVGLPDAWVNPMPSSDGFVWDVAGDSDPNNGHCFVGLGYDAQGVEIDTWGMLGAITWAAAAKYAVQSGGGELYTLLSADSIAKASAKAPSGFDWAQLEADFKAIGA